ncbi:MAG: phosphoenolpyruvate-protein phosphotransferase [bacterium]|nr:MAG: phosphoenolpyruvate-protein phosphotransferase [bacterium]
MQVKSFRQRVFRGILASPGISIGKAYVLNKFHICIIKHKVSKNGVGIELERFDKALETTKDDMLETTKNSVRSIGENLSLILHPQMQILRDPSLIKKTKQTIEKEQVNAEWALQKTYGKMAARFEKIKDPYFKDRMHDIEVVINRVLNCMVGTEQESLANIKDAVIVIAHDLTPFDTANMASSSVLGFATEVGGKASHTGIIASSLQIPALVGIPRITTIVKTGDTVILDAAGGKIIINPTEEQFELYNVKRRQFLYFDKELESNADFTAKTRDGVVVNFKANIESSRDIQMALSHGAEGIGLYRTEFLFMNAQKPPDENNQFVEYRKVAESIAPYDAIVRTLDTDSDKMTAAYDDEQEPNPALGLGGIRFCLKNPQLFRTQLRAILKASHYGKLKVMYPMVSGVEELRKANRFLEKQKRELEAEGVSFDMDIKVGMMVETPSAALLIHQFAPHVDFFSIGTNDLIQYLLAIDRANEKVAYLYQPLHPAVIRLLHMIIQAANQYGVPVSVCGKMSSDPLYAYMLIGMGDIKDLSMNAHSIPKVKKFMQNVSVAEAKKHMQKILELSRTRDIKKYLVANVSPLLIEGMFSEVTIEEYGNRPYQ